MAEKHFVHAVKLQRTFSYIQVNPVVSAHFKRSTSANSHGQRYRRGVREQIRWFKQNNVQSHDSDFCNRARIEHEHFGKVSGQKNEQES